MFYEGLDTAVVDTTEDDDRWLCEFDGEAIELNDLTAWRTNQNANTKIAETPIKDSDPLTEMLNEYNNKMVYGRRESDEDEDDDDDDEDDSDDDTVEECSECGWDPVYINADGSVDVTLSDAETDDIEDFISLLSEPSKSNSPVKMTNLSKIAPWTFEESTTRSGQNFTSRSERPIVITPATSEFGEKATLNKRGETVASPEKTSHMTLSLVKMNKSRQSQNLQLIPTKEQIEEENRLRGGATIVAKLPFRKSSEMNKKILDRVKHSEIILQKKETKVAFAPKTTKTQKQTQNSSNDTTQPSSNSNNCGYHIRLRRRNSDNDVFQDAPGAEIVAVGPKCKCHTERNEKCVAIRAPPCLFLKQQNENEVVKMASARKVAIDEMLQISPSSCVNASTEESGSTTSSRKLRRSMSTTRITDELRAKLGLPQLKFDPELTPSSSSRDTPSTDKQSGPFSNNNNTTTSSRRHRTTAAATQTIPLTRFLSDSQVVNSRVFRREVCSRCLYQCCRQDGRFTCDSCIGVERVKNALVLELYADKPQSSGTNVSRSGTSSTCYGVRIGAGLIPIVVLFLSILICSVVLMSDSMMSNVCNSYCEGDGDDGGSSTMSTGSVWSWIERYKG